MHNPETNDPLASPAGVVDFPCDVERLSNGNTLITDAGAENGTGSEIIEVDPAGQIVWQYSDGLRFAHSAKRLESGHTLIADTTNDRVIEVDSSGKTVFSSESWGGGSGRLSDGSRLCYPNDAHPLPDGTILITDRNNDRCVQVDRDGRVVWSYSGTLKHPHNCDLLPNGNVLIANSDGNGIVEIDRAGQIVWGFEDPDNPLSWPRDADRLENGNTLITDSKNHRVLEITPLGAVAWEYKVPYFANFYDSDRLSNGNTLISDQQHHQVLEVNKDCQIIWLFNNYVPLVRPNDRLENAFFKKTGPDGLPESWVLATRLSEGGGRLIWTEDARGNRVPGLEYDRPGALCLQQKVVVEPGAVYSVSGTVRTENVASIACIQVAWLDAFSGLLQDVTLAPKGTLFTGSSDWTLDAFEAPAPEGAEAAEIRLFINGPGRIWARNLSFFS
jgi:hypothetical protein